MRTKSDDLKTLLKCSISYSPSVFSTSFDHLEDFYYRVWIPWFHKCVEMLIVYVTHGESASRRHTEWKNFGPPSKRKRIKSKYDCVLRIEDQEFRAAVHALAQMTSGEKFERDYFKVGKITYNMLAGGRAPHVVCLATAGVYLKLLLILYGVSHVSLLRTKSYILLTFYTNEAFGKV